MRSLSVSICPESRYAWAALGELGSLAITARHRLARLVAFAVGHRDPRAQEQRPRILRVLLEHFVEPILCLRPVSFGRIERGQPHAGGGVPLIVSGDVAKHLSRVLRALGDGVVVGQRERRRIGRREPRERLEIGLRLRHPSARHVEETQRAVGGGVLDVDLQRGLQLGLGAFLIARRPEEIGEREARRRPISAPRPPLS